jgi:uncharacterized Zn finger protein
LAEEETVIFEVQGSSPEPYKVTFVRRSAGNLSAYCTCPAGDNGQYCKHRFRILDGSTKGIVSANKDEVATITSWLPGTDIEDAIQEMRRLESEQDRIKAELSAAKKKMAAAMRD